MMDLVDPIRIETTFGTAVGPPVRYQPSMAKPNVPCQCGAHEVPLDGYFEYTYFGDPMTHRHTPERCEDIPDPAAS